MESAPIQDGAFSLQGRQRHALVPVLVRVVAIAGFALAGWIVLAALGDPAHAEQQPARPDAVGQKAAPALRHHFTSGHDRPADAVPADAVSADAGVAADVVPGRLRRIGDDPLTYLESWGRGVSRGVPSHVREIGDHPVRYLQSRRHDVFAGKDRAVHHVTELAGAAGVPQVRLPGVRPDAPLVGGLVGDIAKSGPVVGGGLLHKAHELPKAVDETHADDDDKAASSGTTAARTGHPSAAPGAFAGDAGDQEPDRCAMCRDDGRLPAPGPVPASGQDNPRTGGPGGHPLAPVADLRDGRYPAAPPAVDRGTFRRTALTDVAAPGRPSVVPD